MSNIEEVLKRYPEVICTTLEGFVDRELAGEWYIMVGATHECVFLLPTGHLVYGNGYSDEDLALKYFPKDRYVGKAVYHHSRRVE